MVALHPGAYVRKNYLEPKGLSVSAAAKLVGVGRPAFSNFLNGKVSTTPDMAARIEVAFGLPQGDLLALQAAYELEETKAKAAPADVTPYAAPYLGLRARDIESWVERNIPARSRFAVFLRTLVNSTGRGLTKVDFPGNDDAERPGWDGFVEAQQGTPWIPAGVSAWEFGTNEDPKTKADGDFEKGVKAVDNKIDRDVMTFVFVTPRHWPGKKAWIEAQRKKKKWVDVRAYDSSDLEQWLEQSIAAQSWLAREINRPAHGVSTLDHCWEDWANVADPPLPGSLFKGPIEAARDGLVAHLKAPPTRPIVIAADSTGEALAFITQLFKGMQDAELRSMHDCALVFHEPGIVKQLATGAAGFVAIAYSRQVEQELAPLMRKLHCIVVYPRNAANIQPDVVLEPLHYEGFWQPLEAIGLSRDDIARLDTESGRSLTILRRRLAHSAAVRTPNWATDNATAASIVPFLWLGAWDATKRSDQEVLLLLAQESSYEVLEKRCQSLAGLDDAPTWSIGHYRGVTSKIDMLFAVPIAITAADLSRFFEIAQIVLSEDDPKLDLPEDKRAAASIYGKSREFSGTLRRGISETVVLLSVYGKRLFWDRLGFDCETAAGNLVRGLLTPLKTRLLEANDNDLAAYAEAAPGVFLDIVESDLRTDAPETYGLMRPAPTGLFGNGCPRTGLLWALEGLAWNPRTLPRVVRILAQLSQIKINDNWANKPISSLEAIFRAWMPQTAADVSTRLTVLKALAAKFPSLAWHICIDQFRPGPRHGSYSNKPRWRNDGQGFGEPQDGEPVWSFRREAAAMLMAWTPPYTHEMLCNLVDCLQNFPPEHQDRVWSLIAAWATGAGDGEKAIVRERLRQRLLSRRAQRSAEPEHHLSLTKAAARARDALQPVDMLLRHEWLFRQHWVEESADEAAAEDFDFEGREERISARRAEALRDVFSARGPLGLIQLAELGEAQYVIGYVASQRVLGANDAVNTICKALSEPTASAAPRRVLISGLLNGMSDNERAKALDELESVVPEEDYVRVLLAAGFKKDTWNRVNVLSTAAQTAYWDAVVPEWVRGSGSEAAEGVELLMAAKRPRAAFQSVLPDIEKADPELVFRLLQEVATGGSEPRDNSQLNAHSIERAFERINTSSTISLEKKAALELAYIDALAQPGRRSGRGIPNLERYVDEHPDLFVQAIVWTYRRSDGGTDPVEMTPPAEQIEALAHRGYKLLGAIERIPGRDKKGELDAACLIAWINAVRSACEPIGRLQIADVAIGQILAHAPLSTDGVWPCEPVRDALEEVRSEDIMRGAHTGLFNARGAHWRGPGGAQERGLAQNYQAWADALQHSHPFVSSTVLTAMVRTYERYARDEDTDASVLRRMGQA